jgi:hypothetical protein
MVRKVTAADIEQNTRPPARATDESEPGAADVLARLRQKRHQGTDTPTERHADTSESRDTDMSTNRDIDTSTERDADAPTSRAVDKTVLAVRLPADVAEALEAAYHAERMTAPDKRKVSRSAIVERALRALLGL